MRWLSTLRLRLRSLFRRAQVEQELEDELRFHVDQLTARHVERGLSVDDARRTALRTTYGIEAVKDWSRDARRVGWIEDILRDARYALRALRQSPPSPRRLSSPWQSGLPPRQGCSASCNAALLDPFPFTDVERLVRLGMLDKGKPRDLAVTGRQLVALQQSDVLDGAFVSTAWDMTLSGGDLPESVRTQSPFSRAV